MRESEESSFQVFLRTYPKMAIRPSKDVYLALEGKYEFSAKTDRQAAITDSYDLEICIPTDFPQKQPTVYETGDRIPRNGAYHVNPDGSLCLGSPLRVLWKLSHTPTLAGFAENCITPYLFAISHKLRFGGPLLFGELAHGAPGEFADYADLFGLRSGEQAKIAIKYLGMKKRRANKLPCPCDCGRRLGKCRFNWRIREFRRLAERSHFRSLIESNPSH